MQIGGTVGRAVATVRQMPRRAERAATELTNEMRDRLELIRPREQAANVATRLREKAEQTADELKGRARENVQLARTRDATMTVSMLVDVLEERAADQRRQLHNTVVELKSSLRERLDIRRNAREYLLPAAGAAGFFGLVLGYGLTAIFTRR